jgi:hypothetical protein
MNIANGTESAVVNHTYSGYYSQTVAGSRGKLYEFSSPSYPFSNFYPPYDAYLLNSDPTGNKVLAAGRRLRRDCAVSSDRTGSLYFKNDTVLIGGCHGYGHNDLTYYSGYNFYNAFYPAGYFAPPFGENLSIFIANQEGYENLNYGNCNRINATEYNELFGIVSKTVSDAEILSSTLPSNIYAPIFSPREACPPEVASVSYFDEFQFSHIPGASTQLGGNNHYNGNPIPTSLDSFDIKVASRYETTTVGDDVYIVYQSQRPKASYTASSESSKLNNTLCLATLLETRVAGGRGQNGAQLIEAPDALWGGIGDQVSFNGTNDFYNWHFTFRENAETLPFYNNFNGIDASGLRQRKSNEGTQLFIPVISSDDAFWQNRQCPDTVDFLPHTVGASIYACPSEHFDVPYYAALRKFGFYGLRFMNTCRALSLDHDLSGVENAAELPQQSDNYLLGEDEIEPSVDTVGNWSFATYNNLLRIAKAEERYANMYALNKGFFIWANSGHISADSNFIYLSGNNPSFVSAYVSLVSKFQDVFQSGLTSFTGTEPLILLDHSQGGFTIIEQGKNVEVLTTNDAYDYFKKTLNNVLIQGEMNYWNQIENRFGNYVSNGSTIDDEFYQRITSGREKRIRTRYFENLIRGNAIDLYPFNNIVFSFDQAKDYYESTGWGRKESSFGAGSDLPVINKRYFEGAYGRKSAITGLIDALNSLGSVQTDYYYPGFFQDIKIDKFLPAPKYVPAVSGKILDTSSRSFSPSGWLALGYNEIGAYDANFSCFTPIFIQQPLPRVFTKIGQQPTLRAQAVDYHTLPEDKISRRYPEIIYWASRLKLLDCAGRNQYPLRYKWYRVRKDIYNSSLASGELIGNSEPANHNSEWGCLEGDGPECTLFHPRDSIPYYSDTHSENDYTFIRGAIKNLDDNYYYYCTVTGRFGVRMSNISELQIEDWIRFDMSVKNGTNGAGSVNIKFEITDHLGTTREVEFEPEGDVQSYAGYQQDLDTTPETVIEQKIPPPNAGFGDVTAVRFIGPIGYIGATRTYTPSALKDTRGLKETWGHLLDYGQLIGFSKKLNQKEGEWLYGYSHLPVCENYSMLDGKKGVKVIATMNGGKVGHWSLPQRAVASLDMKAGIQHDRLLNFGELYPPANGRFESPNFGIGHWQWGNNLGAIKRFGKNSTFKDIRFVGGWAGSDSTPRKKILEEIKDELISPTDLAGENCGYHPYGLGRNMIYYLEAFERFYILCDPLKKKNVTNKSFICPGIRMNNSAIQYFWLGKPRNTYLKRRAMYGPYAYQWKVNRHNRDRNGNGMSEGFYSMGHRRTYDLMYDAPAIYGLYVKKDSNPRFQNLLKQLKEAKDRLQDRYDLKPQELRRLWWGERGTEETARRYGDISYTCDNTRSTFDEDICNYISSAKALASDVDFADHICPQDLLSEGNCFDPCMSIRYAQGFFPGGKLLDLFNNVAATSANDKKQKRVRIVPTAKIRNSSVVLGDEKATNDTELYFRSPLGTPHSRITMGYRTIRAGTEVVDGEEVGITEKLESRQIGGISPCQDGGSDHCNYITPTLHLGISSYLIGQSNAFAELKNYNANVYSTDTNIRGEIS